MSIRVGLYHQTSYQFDRPVELGPHMIRLRPAAHSRTPIEAYSLTVFPKKHFINWQQDPFGNHIARLVFPEKTTELRIEVDLVADLIVINPFDFFLEESAETFPFTYEESLREQLAPYMGGMEESPLLDEWMKSVSREETRTIDFLVGLNQRLASDIRYTIRMEPGVQTCEQTLDRHSGSCRDSAWLLIQILRRCGLAARFVSGYLVQLKADVASLDGPSGTDKDFTDLHAWAEVFAPGAGWIGLDPTSGLFAGEGHIPLACVPDPASGAPVTGVSEPCEVEFGFANRVDRLHEDPRVTRPYSEAQWQDILSLGDMVESRLQEDDVRLTMGGEPTFVGIDHVDKEEWNTAADGKHKRERSAELLNRLHKIYAPGGLLHHGQGKWYPGEPLPRWAMNCYWRSDGAALWKDPALLANPTTEGEQTIAQARDLACALERALDLPGNCVSPAYEDALYFLWSEGTLPMGMDLIDEKLDSASERHRLRELLDQEQLGEPAGFVLPLERADDSPRWVSCRWQFSRGHLFLVPGNSPAGMRLPLKSLQEETGPPAQPQSVWQEMPELPATPEPTESGLISEEVVHTALCCEIRDGHVCVFLPPLTSLEDYIALITIIEHCAASLKLPVIIEGYEPPADPRLRKLAVTPDPGVIEVNIHPGSNWRELVDNTEQLYETAHLSRLTTEKFLLDGRHTGTGGGNHVTIGGATPKDSPVLRRPSLLRSLVTFWQHHPGLSYLFSGLFVGPTSQAPRVDEGRDENLYELELAFSQIPDGDVDQPWLADRLLRNLLVDITGNTHRAEFCVDKLYSPDSASGRQGLLEFRAFEMPPHARMSLLQMLLLRALIACFWREPYKHELVRWGTSLHDRFMLPYFLRQDMDEVIAYLHERGFAFDREWLDPFFEFRFPVYGESRNGDLSIELRLGIEPWKVLGEETTGSGTTRFVDSSTERLQVRIQGMNPQRHQLCCNGVPIPLVDTGTRGDFVAGIRYQAWQQTSALHPLLKVHTPLVFDLIDRWNNRPVMGCTYHVGHPGGRNYETNPVNAWEAEGRRVSRFWEHGHTPARPSITPSSGAPTAGQFAARGTTSPVATRPAEPRVNPEYPCTLDLRR